jgi:hypothetical protein
MKPVEAIQFVDLDSGDEAMVFVRAGRDSAGLALSLKQDGDIEVFFGPNELDRLIGALQKARAIVSGGASSD